MTLRKTESDFLSGKRQALKYVEMGLLVVPVHTVRQGRCSCGSSCDRPAKHPIARRGVKDATTDRNQIKAWWSEWPDANIGLAPGHAQDFIVLDIDPRHGGDKRLKRLEGKLGALPETVTADTGGGGRHLFFKYPGFKIRKDNSGKVFGRGIDVLCDGCVVVAPPSRHASGQQYAWVKGKSFLEREPAKLPRAWRKRLRKRLTRSSDSDRTNTDNTAGEIPEGKRNNRLTRLAGTMQRTGMSPEAILAALLKENEAKCSPPLAESEVRKIVRSIGSYTPLSNDTDPAEALMQIVLDRYFGSGKHLLRGSDGRFWHYDVRLWRPVSEDWVSGKILKVLQSTPVKGQKTASLLSQVLTLLRAKLAVENDPLGFLNDPHPVINCANGELWIWE